MDTITQMILGAAVAQAVGYKKLGGKAVLFGAVAGGIPDLDVFWTSFLGEHGGWLYHRHVTHALWFGPVFGALMGWGLWRHYGRQAGQLGVWIASMVLACLSHPFLDYFTIYGTQLLAPFSNQRFEISGVSIIDPVYTVMLFVAILILAVKKWRPYGSKIAGIAFIVSTAYLLYGVHLNNKAEQIAEAQLKEQGVQFTKVEAFTTIFQQYMRRIVVREPDGVRVGFVSTFAPSHIYWTCRKDIPDAIKQAILKSEDAQVFDWFTSGHLSFATSHVKDEIIVTDLRYGVPGPSVFGWWGERFRVTANQDGGYDAVYLGGLHVEREASGSAIGNLFKATFGYPNNFLPTEDKDCTR